MFLLQKEDMFLQRRIGTIAALKNSHNEKQIKTTFVCVSKKWNRHKNASPKTDHFFLSFFLFFFKIEDNIICYLLFFTIISITANSLLDL